MSLSKFILLIGEFMVRKIKARGHNSQLENLRVHLIPSSNLSEHSPEQEKEVISLLAKIIQLGRKRGRKVKTEELDYVA